MSLVFMDYQGGSRYRVGYIYKVSEKVRDQLCDEPGPMDCTGGRPYARELNSAGAKLVEKFLGVMGLNLPIKAPEELGLVPYSIEPPDFVDAAAELTKARSRAAVAEARVAELETENVILAERVAELEAGAPAVVDAVNLAELKVEELQEMLKERDLPTSGKKDELIARLKEHEAAQVTE